jgi:CheY-like chemotaxis protein
MRLKTVTLVGCTADWELGMELGLWNQAHNRQAGKRILVVDDEEGMRMLYSMELEDEGYEVITHPDGQGLMETIEKLCPDCVVLDIKMKEYDGLDLLQDIRRQYYDLPVILNSGYSSFKVDRKALAANRYVNKSSDLTELKEWIIYCLESVESGGQLPVADRREEIKTLIKLYLNDYEQGHLDEPELAHLSDDFRSFSLVKTTRLQTIYANSNLRESDVEELFTIAHKCFQIERTQVQSILRENAEDLRVCFYRRSRVEEILAKRTLEAEYRSPPFDLLSRETFWHLAKKTAKRLQE